MIAQEHVGNRQMRYTIISLFIFQPNRLILGIDLDYPLTFCRSTLSPFPPLLDFVKSGLLIDTDNLALDISEHSPCVRRKAPTLRDGLPMAVLFLMLDVHI